MSVQSERIKQLVESSNMSYQDLEKLTGIKKSSLQRYASGVTSKVPLEAIEKLSKAFNVSQNYLMGRGLTIGKMISQNIAHNISHHRSEAGLSAKQLADMIGVDECYVLGLESGQIKLEQDVLYKICDVLHLIPRNFIPRDEEFSEDEEYLLSRREKETLDQLQLTEREMALLEMFRRFPEVQQDSLILMVKKFESVPEASRESALEAFQSMLKMLQIL